MDFTLEQQQFIANVVRQANQGLAAGIPAANRGTPRSIPCTNYSTSEDFELWVATFEDTVRMAYNLARDHADLNGHFLNWISTKLNPDARTAYTQLPANTRADWLLLRAALIDTFSDEHDRLEFLSRMDSFQRKPDMSLKEYRNQLLQKMNRYQQALIAVPEEFQRTAVQRFRDGLGDKAMAAHIMMMCRGDRQTLNDAFETASSWEATMKHCLREDPNLTKAQARPLLGTMYGLQAAMAPIEQNQDNQAANPRVLAATSEPLNDLATKVKEHEMGIAELKAAQTLTNDNLTGLRNDVQGIVRTMNQGFGISANPQQPRPYPGPQFPGAQYPRPRQPSFPIRGGYTPGPQYGYATNPRPPRTIVQGLTGGPGYVNRPLSLATPNPRPLAPIEAPPAEPVQYLTIQQPTQQTAHDHKTQDQGHVPYYSNPNIPQLPEMGAFDTGFGWSNSEHNTSTIEGYDLQPTGAYSYGSQHF
jgi:hypothetical protein